MVFSLTPFKIMQTMMLNSCCFLAFNVSYNEYNRTNYTKVSLLLYTLDEIMKDEEKRLRLRRSAVPFLE